MFLLVQISFGPTCLQGQSLDLASLHFSLFHSLSLSLSFSLINISLTQWVPLFLLRHCLNKLQRERECGSLSDRGDAVSVKASETRHRNLSSVEGMPWAEHPVKTQWLSLKRETWWSARTRCFTEDLVCLLVFCKNLSFEGFENIISWLFGGSFSEFLICLIWLFEYWINKLVCFVHFVL